MKKLKFNVPAWAGAAIVALAIGGGLAACSDQGVSPVEVQQEQRVQPVGPAYNTGGGVVPADTTTPPTINSDTTTTRQSCDGGGGYLGGSGRCEPI